jgi:hypothetical protein
MTAPRHTGWYPDTSNSAFERYWDGDRWTGEERPVARRSGGRGISVGFVVVVAVLLASAGLFAVTMLVGDDVTDAVEVVAEAPDQATRALIAADLANVRITVIGMAVDVGGMQGVSASVEGDAVLVTGHVTSRVSVHAPVNDVQMVASADDDTCVALTYADVGTWHVDGHDAGQPLEGSCPS